MTRRIRIETVVLENVPAGQRAALLRAFQAELMRLATQAPPAGSARAVLPAPASATAAGEGAAQVVARRIGGAP